MGYGFKAASGGGSLNFSVKTYTTEEALLADTPRENTVGVVTNTAVPKWSFSASEPSAPEEGEIWFSLGTESDAAFNALKKNILSVYPKRCRQYLSGAWTNVSAYIYKSGVWVQFSKTATYLYYEGDECADLTGGWTAKTGGGSGTKTAEKLETSLHVYDTYTSGSATYTGFYAENSINFDSINELIITATVNDATTAGWGKLCVNRSSGANASTPNNTSTVASAAFADAAGEVTVTLDTSGVTGANYIGFYIQSGSADRTAEVYVTAIEYREA